MHLFTMQHGLDGAVLDVPEDVLGLCSFLAAADLEPLLEALEARAGDDARAEQVQRRPEPLQRQADVDPRQEDVVPDRGLAHLVVDHLEERVAPLEALEGVRPPVLGMGHRFADA